MLKNILIATNFSAASRAALRAAINLCKDAGSMLHVVHVLPKMDGRIYKVMSHLAEQDMEAFFPADLYPNNKKVILFCDSACEVILQYAKENDCDLIVLGARSRAGIGDLIGHSLTWKLQHATTKPLMLVRDTGSIETGEHHVSKILSAVHFSRLSKKAFQFAIKAARILSADLHVVCIIDRHQYSNSEGLESLCKATDIRIRSLVSAESTKRNFPISRLTVNILSGNPPEEITKYMANNAIDLIVIGSHPARGILGALMPDLASTVLSKAEIPEIVISDGSFGKHRH